MATILVAYDANRVIGNKNAIPWKLSEDLKLFAFRTIGRTVIMGRKTYESLPKKPLPKRHNIVLSSNWNVQPNTLNVSWADNLDNAIDMCERGKECYIIGGEQVYRLALSKEHYCDRIIATEVFGTHQGDAFFPRLNSEWVGKTIETNGVYNIVEYRR